MTGDRDIELGVVSGAHGLHGELVVRLHNPASDALDPGRTVRLSLPSGAVRSLRVEAWRNTGKARAVAFEGVEDRTAAEALRGARVLVRRSDLPPPAEGEFYYEDLPGLPVRLPDGTEVGRVASVFRGATDILVLDVGGREVLVPCVAGFVADVGERAVVVEPAALEEPA